MTKDQLTFIETPHTNTHEYILSRPGERPLSSAAGELEQRVCRHPLTQPVTRNVTRDDEDRGGLRLLLVKTKISFPFLVLSVIL